MSKVVEESIKMYACFY